MLILGSSDLEVHHKTQQLIIVRLLNGEIYENNNNNK